MPDVIVAIEIEAAAAALAGCEVHPILRDEIRASEAEAAAAARTALLDELETAVEGWRSEDHGLFSGAVVDGWLVHRGAVLREINRRRP